MRSSLLKGLAVALVVAGVLVPAAAAKPRHPHHPALKLGLVPLPKARLGSAVAGLQLAPGSGREGTGAQLNYGSLFFANPGLDMVGTGVEEYRNARVAKHVLAEEKKANLGSLSDLTQLNVTASVVPLAVPPTLGDRAWAGLATFSVPNINPLYLVIEAFSAGKYVLHLVVAGGSQDLVTSYTASKAGALERRLHLGLNGRLHGHPVALPKFPPLGPPDTGPDPATAVLQTSDLPGSEINNKGYGYFSGALSSYSVFFTPAGSFDELSQTVTAMPSSNSATFSAAFIGADEIALTIEEFGSDTVVTPVDVSAAGDDAQAAIVSVSSPDPPGNIAIIALHSGPVADVVFVRKYPPSTIDPATVQTLAQAAATRLDAALS